MAIVDTVFRDFKDAVAILEVNGEISLQNSLEGNFRKTLLLSAASYFEHCFLRSVEEFVGKTSKNAMVLSLVKNRVVARQYHTWFDWNSNNANAFFGMFGEAFKKHMKEILSENDALDRSIRSFIEIGRDRNRIVHQDYGSAYVEKTAEEIYEEYKSAHLFLDTIQNELHACFLKLPNDD